MQNQPYVIVPAQELQNIYNILNTIMLEIKTNEREPKALEKEYLSINEAIAKYGYGYQYWYNKVKKEGKLQNFGEGRNILIRINEIERMLGIA